VRNNNNLTMNVIQHAALLFLTAASPWLRPVPIRAAPASSQTQPVAIVLAGKAAPLERLAAREIRRYLYLRTGCLLPIQEAREASASRGDLIVLARKDHAVLGDLGVETPAEVSALAPEQYLLQTLFTRERQILLAAGGDAVGTLYAGYRLAEHLGVRFYLHGDVVPDRQGPLRIPPLNELGRPLFAVRGIQPFHDFPEGPDWWNADDYLAVLSQLPKLRMNFFGLHTYPEGGPNAEPTVWIGLPQDIGPGATVKASYPSSYQNTLRGNWGYQAKKTSEFALGGSLLFERDDFGAEVMWGHVPQPTTPEGCNELFARVGGLLRQAFIHARQLGVQTCVGTETPLTVPRAVAERIESSGRNAKDLAVITELYEGLFRRATQAYPLDYYWFWTPEGWTWEGTKAAQIAATTNDLFAALAAHAKVKPPFRLATCGWVLGPQQDRALFDRILPKDMPVSCINREVGKTPVDPAFAKVTGRGKWAIPWLEDDPALTAPQLWVGRMRRDAAEARAYGCDGLMGIHWRTRVLGPAVSALAAAAWDQSRWNPSPDLGLEPVRRAGPVGGKYARFPNHAIADTEDDPLYQSVRYNVSAYHLLAPNGTYTVTLKFCEPNYKEAGKRVFGVKLQDRTVLEHFDIFARVGKDRAIDFTYENIAVTNGWLSIEFVPEVEYPSIAALVVSSPRFTSKINCAGPAYQDFAADWPEAEATAQKFPPTADFYLDWARSEFGEDVAAPAAALFERLDGRLPRPADWVHGPGGIRPDARPWSEVSKDYGFVDEFAALRPKVKGAGHRERFDWWLNTFEYLRAMGQVNCAWGAFTNAMGQVQGGTHPAARQALAQEKALPRRRELVQHVTRMYSNLLATVSNPGEMGTVANWEQHNFPDLLTKPGKQLAEWLGGTLPADAQLASGYVGPTRIIVPTRRTSYTPDDDLLLKVIILAQGAPREATLRWRPLGEGRFRSVPLRHVARGVYQAQFPRQATAGDDVEYYVEVLPAKGGRVVFPATAPRLNQTLVAQPVSP
jgi:hypothetical protein